MAAPSVIQGRKGCLVAGSALHCKTAHCAASIQFVEQLWVVESFRQNGWGPCVGLAGAMMYADATVAVRRLTI